ncbi:MAG: glycyl-radical enzyme activating protein [Deltaproteobacteria bacterium]|nr:glycyl-radical enzyme activating protein [Deltaproteobacteria bacterium]
MLQKNLDPEKIAMPDGLVFNLQQFSTEDGPGIRTTVFLKGCPLRCPWCHNPEGLRPEPDLMWYGVRCIGAQHCLSACPEKALHLFAEGMGIDRGRCTLCGKCQEACPAGALEIIGRTYTPDELISELLKDLVFYKTSGGGITFSGGEPMLQADFLVQALRRCRQEELHTALDTCGAVSGERFKPVLPLVDLVLFDLKLMDPERHRSATGVSNDIILDNARCISAEGKPMWIRTPVIPGLTDDVENIRSIGEFIRDFLPTVERWDLLAYTYLGRPKYERLDLPYALKDKPLLTKGEMEDLHRTASELVPTAVWSGMTG